MATTAVPTASRERARRRRHGEVRAQGAQGAGVRTGRLRGERDRDRLGGEEDRQQDVHGDRGRQGEADEEGGGQDAGGHARHRGDAVGQGGPARTRRVVKVEEGRSRGAGGRAGGRSLQDPGGDQRSGAVRRGQQHHGGGLQQQSAHQDGAPPEVVGERPGREQGHQQRQGMGAEDHGDGERGQIPGVLVVGVEGRRRTGCREEGGQDRGVQDEGRRAAGALGAGPRVAGSRRCAGCDGGHGTPWR